MTPLQLNKYSKYKSQYKKDIVLDKKRKDYNEKIAEINLFIAQENPDYEFVEISKYLTFFFYHKKQ